MEVIKNAQMKEYSNMKVGGIAKELIFVEEKNELKEIIKGDMWHVMGPYGDK